MIPLERIHPHRGNIRKDLGDLTELATSIRARGVLQPLVVAQTGRGFVVLDGHRRLAAAKLAGVATVPCLAVKAGDDERDTAVMLAAAMHKALEPIERAAAFKRLRRRGLSVSEIARRTGYSTSTVSQGLMIADLPAEAQDMVAEKQITVTQATQMAREVRRSSTGTASVRAPRPAWFTPEHRLAPAVRAACGHTETRKVLGKAGCGQCWEDAIRFDERERAATRQPVTSGATS
nr:ParB/RepB/Spo0J family partition protein [Cellulomonas sp. APG4]